MLSPLRYGADRLSSIGRTNKSQGARRDRAGAYLMTGAVGSGWTRFYTGLTTRTIDIRVQEHHSAIYIAESSDLHFHSEIRKLGVSLSDLKSEVLFVFEQKEITLHVCQPFFF